MGIRIKETLLTPENLKIPSWQDYAPTVKIEVFEFKSDKQAVYELLKSALYAPAQERKTDRDAFKLRAHGILVSSGKAAHYAQ